MRGCLHPCSFNQLLAGGTHELGPPENGSMKSVPVILLLIFSHYPVSVLVVRRLWVGGLELKWTNKSQHQSVDFSFSLLATHPAVALRKETASYRFKYVHQSASFYCRVSVEQTSSSSLACPSRHLTMGILAADNINHHNVHKMVNDNLFLHRLKVIFYSLFLSEDGKYGFVFDAHK